MSWKQVRFSELFDDPKRDIISGPFGSNLKATEYVDEGVPLVRLQNVDRFSFLNKNIKYITAQKAKQLSSHQYDPGDILITKLGDPLGKACVVPDDVNAGVIMADIVRARLRSGKALREFVVYQLNSNGVIAQLQGETKGATRPRVNLEHIRDLELLMPPLPEQQRIVTKLDASFAALAEAQAHVERNRANARELFESYLNGVFEGEGSEWPEHEMGQVCEVKDGTHDSPTYLDSGIPFVTQKNVTPEGLSLANTRFISQEDHDNFYRRSNAAKGDVLISMIGANRGMACLVDDQPVFSIKNVGLVKRNERVNERFLLAYLKSRRASDFVKTRSKGGAQEFIGLTELRKFPVPVPDRKKQDSVADEFDVLRFETKQLESTYQQKLMELEGLKKGLLGAAFRGEL